MASKDSQNQRGRGLRGFLPGASGPDGNLTTSASNTGHQVWQPPRPLPGSIPPGLEYLSQLDLIIIHQQVELLGMILGTETTNKYEIKNSLGQRIYFAVEESLCFNRTFCSTLRSCILRVSDNSGQEVITVHRPLRCNSCWCPCYLQELEIEAPPGTLVAYVAQKWDPFRPKFTIQNANREDILKIVGPCATCSCFGDVNFEVRTMNEKLTIGKISKYWSGFVNDVFTNADNFGIHIPADLDVTLKAAMMGACFLFIFIVKEIFPSAIVWNDCTIQIMPQTSSQGTVQWVRSTGSISKNHPPELDCLTEVNQLLICQRFDLLRVLSLVANSKTYEVVNNQGERIFFAEESSNCFIRHLCGPSRPFTITFYDNSGREVITMHKTIGCRCCWSNCYLQKLKVQAPPGETIGYVYQYFHPFLANFKIMNKKKESVMLVRGPCVISSCLKNLKFDLFYLDEEMGVGIISQQWAEFIREPVSHLGKFGIQFPFNLDVKIKALVLGASFLIDCMYFEIWS